jgi:hypothetical protein
MLEPPLPRFTAAPTLRADGTIAAICPSCGTVGTTFRPEPGAMVWQRCPRRGCAQMFAVYVWPHWMDLMGLAPVDAGAAAD